MVQGPCKATHLMQPAIPCSTRAQLQVIKRRMMRRAYGMTKTLSLAKFLKIRHHSSCAIDSQVLQLLCLQLCLKYCHENVLENASVMDTRLAMLCVSSMFAADDTLTSNSVCVSLGLAGFCVQYYTQLSKGIEYSLLNCHSRVDRTTRAPVVNYASSAALHGRLSLIVIFGCRGQRVLRRCKCRSDHTLICDLTDVRCQICALTSESSHTDLRCQGTESGVIQT